MVVEALMGMFNETGCLQACESTGFYCNTCTVFPKSRLTYVLNTSSSPCYIQMYL